MMMMNPMLGGRAGLPFMNSMIGAGMGMNGLGGMSMMDRAPRPWMYGGGCCHHGPAVCGAMNMGGPMGQPPRWFDGFDDDGFDDPDEDEDEDDDAPLMREWRKTKLRNRAQGMGRGMGSPMGAGMGMGGRGGRSRGRDGWRG